MPDKSDLDINTSAPYDAAKNLEKLYRNVYLKHTEADLPENEPEMTICLKHEQPISFRVRWLAYADKMKLSVLLDDLIKNNIIRESTSPQVQSY